jgi:hypothetical protein
MGEIRITRAMIEVGTEALSDANDLDDEEVVASIYRAMAAAGLPPDENEGRPVLPQPRKELLDLPPTDSDQPNICAAGSTSTVTLSSTIQSPSPEWLSIDAPAILQAKHVTVLPDGSAR